MKNNKGITLIALVITIIVLLILVGVTLAMVTGDNSIFSKATTAAEETALAQGKELAAVLVSEYIADYYDYKYVNKDLNKVDADTTVGQYVDKVLTDLYDGLSTGKQPAAFQGLLEYASPTFTIKDGKGNVVATGTLDKTKSATIEWSK